jgi:hypothetical protein
MLFPNLDRKGSSGFRREAGNLEDILSFDLPSLPSNTPPREAITDLVIASLFYF